ncbi:MAG: hypothetical protein QM647_18345 [Asticcacaulis sp.]|uniref:hypothetical protein n=1 Tax=Asticcacaulis sp. TaxID=1872648 RepID=UPI0039E59B14
MRANREFRLVFLVDRDTDLLVIRPIGRATGQQFLEKLFEAYHAVEAVWRYKRVHDHRRFDGFMTTFDYEENARRWIALTDGNPLPAFAAIVMLEPDETVRIARPSHFLPHETVCRFTDYHEAGHWLNADNKEDYLARLRQSPETTHRKDSGEIY